MNRRNFNSKILLLLVFIGFLRTGGISQNNYITLEEALALARKNYAGLERDRLSVEQQNLRAKAGVQQQPSQLFLSGEEFDFNNQSGVHSLNLQQNFYLPRVNEMQRAYYEQGAAVAERQLALTDQQLKREVGQAYYQLLYAKQEQEIAAESLGLYNDFLSVTTAQLATGETGKIPQLAARSRLGQAELELEHTLERYQIALTLFNQWLRSDTLYDAQGGISAGSLLFTDSILPTNPHLQIIQAQQELALAKVEVEKTQLLPQINSGLKLQTASSTFPLFGYQLGVNVPLFKKAYQGRIEAAEIGVKMEAASLATQHQMLERTLTELRHRLEHHLHILEYLEEDLTPIINEQREVNLQAYREGEIGYLEYLDSLEQVVQVRQQHLEALYNFNVLRIELDYWLGR